MDDISAVRLNAFSANIISNPPAPQDGVNIDCFRTSSLLSPFLHSDSIIILFSLAQSGFEYN